MGEPVPIAVVPKKQGVRRSGRLPLPASPSKIPSPWTETADPAQYDLRRLPKAVRDEARLARAVSPAKTSPPRIERIASEPVMPRITAAPVRVQAKPQVVSSPATLPRVLPEKPKAHSPLAEVALVIAPASLLTSLGLVLALSLLLARVPLHTPLSIPLRSGAPEAQVQAFLATLLHLPQIDSVRFLTKEAQLARAEKLSPALPEAPLNPFADTVEVSVASLRSEALLGEFLSQPSLQVLLDERLLVSLASWEAEVGGRMEELRVLRQLASLLAVLSLASFFLVLSAARPLRREVLPQGGGEPAFLLS